ncbi:MAG: membrane-binding protein [Flavobacteriaceae bacterium]|nr:membrane-binding protein [Flavobacteriaceae bacterium]
MAKSYSEKITAVKVMVDGIKKMKDNLPLGVTEASGNKMEELRNVVEQLNSEQEALKADLKKKTEEMNTKISEMEKLYNDAKKRIKLDVEQSLWKTFGIDDKK